MMGKEKIEIKCLSLYQPWASAVACGSKLIETRSWQTKYRGAIAIHAGKKRLEGLDDMCRQALWYGALFGTGQTLFRKASETLPFGKIVALASLIACVRVEDVDRYVDIAEMRKPATSDPIANLRHSWTEQDMGDYSSGRYAWIFDDVRRVEPAIDYKAQQGLFNLPHDIAWLTRFRAKEITK